MKTDMIVKTGVFVALTVLLSYIFAIHTTFIHITFGFYNKAVSAIFIGRLIKNIICFPLEIALILIVYKAVSKFMVQRKS